MKVTIKPVMSYIVSDERGDVIGEFNQQGEVWEGMVKLTCKPDYSIICDDIHPFESELFGNIFGNIFGAGGDVAEKKLNVIKCSPSLISVFESRKSTEGKQG